MKTAPASNATDPDEEWKLKHSFARIFYTTFHEPIMELWKKIHGKKGLRPSLWTEFVESKELWEMVYEKLRTLSSFSHDLFADTELAEDGREALTQERETYFLVPLVHSICEPVEGSALEAIMSVDGRMRLACREFLKTLLIYVFADIYKKEFIVYYAVRGPIPFDRHTIDQRLFSN